MALAKNYFFVALVLTKWHETFSTQQESFLFWALALFWALVQRFHILSNNADDTQTYHRETGITKSNGWTSNQGGYNHDFKVLQNLHIPFKFSCGSCQFLNRNIIKNIQAPPTLSHPVHVFPVGNELHTVYTLCLQQFYLQGYWARVRGIPTVWSLTAFNTLSFWHMSTKVCGFTSVKKFFPNAAA